MPVPKKRNENDFERIKKEHLDEWLVGHIEEVEYDPEHQFKGEHAKVCEGVRFKLRLEGYRELKYSRWMMFSYSPKSNLYKTFIIPLVDGCFEYFEFDVQDLEKMRIKVMYGEDTYKEKVYQNIKLIKPLDSKFKYEGPKAPELPTIQLEEKSEDKVPF